MDQVCCQSAGYSAKQSVSVFVRHGINQTTSQAVILFAQRTVVHVTLTKHHLFQKLACFQDRPG